MAKWTAASGARFARQARAETVAHMETAAVARELRSQKLTRAYEVHATNFRSREAARIMLFGGLGYRPPYPDSWADAADVLTRDDTRHLAVADLYVVAPPMCDVVIAAAQSLTVEDLQLLDEEDLPSPAGLLVLPYPVIVRSAGGDLGDDRAFCWHSPATFAIPDQEADDGLRARPGVRISTYHDTHGPVRPDSFRQLLAEARRQGIPLPPLLLDGSKTLCFRATDADPEAPARLAEAARKVDGAYRRAAEFQGHTEEHVVGEYVSGSEIHDADGTFVMRFLYAFWRLCEQRIAAVEHTETGHAARLAAEKSGMPADVRVVRLRRRDVTAAGEPTPRAWQHRWMVKVHKVRQWYPSEGRHKVIYRGPYVKGPADMPLLGGDTVRALVR
ncbi:hypothetical protein ACIA5D_51515 [Actinoplanes sp. NPDC051513]|uniref:hypothetical protein n=1 Tax=Actinoplanes sp. NPDC051513 TaxID=3363908 RepID=UPI0037AB0AEA